VPQGDSRVYYFEVGQGRWRGKFSFRVTSWSHLRGAPIGLTDRMLVVGMALFSRLVGTAKISSEIVGHLDQGEAGVAYNQFRLHRFGLTLYRLDESYTLDPSGRDVQVDARERFGPVPFLFRNRKRHPAVIHPGGLASTYYIPLLGADWTATYSIRPDRRHIDGQLTCRWAEAKETMDKAAG
jgi:hypothetical protein